MPRPPSQMLTQRGGSVVLSRILSRILSKKRSERARENAATRARQRPAHARARENAARERVRRVRRVRRCRVRDERACVALPRAAHPSARLRCMSAKAPARLFCKRACA